MIRLKWGVAEFKKIRGEKIPTLSLFSGAGGLDIGFALAGFDIKACVEIEGKYCDTLEANAKEQHLYGRNTVVHQEDIREFDCTPYKNMGIRCVIGGPPCQTFSAAGRRAGGVIGTEDQRGQLFLAYCKILRELQPEVFVFENVYGLPGANGGKPWAEIVSAFSAIGYTLREEVVDAADYGVPQHRERLIMVGFREGEYTFPLPTHGPDAPAGSPSLVSVEEAIRDLQDVDEPYHDNLGGLYGHLLALVPEGLNYSYFTAEMGHPEPVFAWRSKFHDLLYKVDRTSPCRTIKAQPGKFTGPFHWKNRHFTVAELKRLQTFPDDYQIVGNFSRVVEQIGNSVPPLLAHCIAISVREQLLDKTGPKILAARPSDFKSTFRQRQRLRSHEFDKIAERSISEQYNSGTKKASTSDNQPRKETYYLNPNNLFDKKQYKNSSKLDQSSPIYKILVSERNKAINLKFSNENVTTTDSFEIIISGLTKYLPNYETLTAAGSMAEVGDIFHIWGAIEDALVKRSRFFTLIDIYGHYANRGDTVNIIASFHVKQKSALILALNYFANTDKCGDFIEYNALKTALNLSRQQLDRVIEEMRDIRFDIRTAKTHPIIGDGRVLCTYPFPLLSPRALVESRVQFTSTE